VTMQVNSAMYCADIIKVMCYSSSIAINLVFILQVEKHGETCNTIQSDTNGPTS
jgi:hypothetical protein